MSSLIAKDTDLQLVRKQVTWFSLSDENIMYFNFRFENSIDFHLLVVDVMNEINERKLLIRGINFKTDK